MLDDLSKLPLVTLMRLLVTVVVRVDQREFTAGKGSKPCRLRWYASVPAQSQGSTGIGFQGNSTRWGPLSS